jgi:hypothetical protein
MGVGASRKRRPRGAREVEIILACPNEDYWSHWSVGITSLGGRFMFDMWPYENQESTARCYTYDYKQRIYIDDEEVLVTLSESAGSSLNFSHPAYIRQLISKPPRVGDVTGVAFCYDVTKLITWEHLKGYVDSFVESLPSESLKRKMLIVACKCDLVDEREVDLSTVQAYADRNGILHIETSAKENVNVEFAFVNFAAQLMACDDEKM